MGIARVSLSLVGVIAAFSVVLAAATVWLLLTDPVTVADALNHGEVTPMVRQLAAAIYDALKGLLKYL